MRAERRLQKYKYFQASIQNARAKLHVKGQRYPAYLCCFRFGP